MAYWNSRGLRGKSLEDLLNFTNDVYRQKKIALIHKIPTSIVPVKISKDRKTIELAYFEKKSAVDYMGLVQGTPICFDAKEIQSTSLPLQNIHSHQIDFMQEFQDQGGISFILVHFSHEGEYYYLPFSILKSFYEKMQQKGRKSIPKSQMQPNLKIHFEGGILHYLKTLQFFIQQSKEMAP